MDADNDRLSYRLVNGPVDGTIDAAGIISWTPAAGLSGDYEFSVRVTDTFGAADSQNFTVSLQGDQTPPEVTLFESFNFVYVGQEQTLWTSATDEVGVETLDLRIDGEPVALSPDGVATVSFDNPGFYEATATAKDAGGNVASASVTIEVLGESDGSGPVIELDPLPDDLITNVISLTGTIDDDNLAEYKFEVAPMGSNDFATIFTGTSKVTSGVLGSFDPTLLLNDTYTLRVTATDTSGEISLVEQTVDVGGDLKLGNFQLSFTDLEIPVSGIPITVTRTYDSLAVREEEDFGPGWRLEFRDTNLRTSLGPDELYEAYGIRKQGFREGDRVYITLPGGKRQTYTFKPREVTQINDSDWGKVSVLYFRKYFLEPVFESEDGNTTTLTVDHHYITKDISDSSNGVFSGFGGEPYNPANHNYGGTYTLTTKEGIVYKIDATTGDLRSLTDRNGNTLTYTDEGIFSDTGVSVTFERDAQGRIKSVIDPAGEKIVYEYDAVTGDLVGVRDRANNTTSLEYEIEERPHYLTGINDPLGREAVRNEYDESGRLKRILDVKGEAVELEYDRDNSTQTVEDVFGNETTLVYDERGNVLTEVDPVGLVTKRTYDDDNNVLTETIITDESGPDGWTTTYTFDSKGNKLTETDALGNVTRWSYNQWGQELTQTDPLGNTTTYTYDDRGNPTSRTDAAGKRTEFGYDARGNLLSMTDAAGNVMELEYDGSGNVTGMRDALGNEIKFTYDRNGNRLSETRTVTTPDGVEELVTRSTYDSENRVTSITDAAGNVIEYSYDENGNQVLAIDALSRSTTSRYAEALKWYKAAAAQNYHVACHRLGEIYAEGQIVPKDEAEAVKWYLKAAELDYRPSRNFRECLQRRITWFTSRRKTFSLLA